MRGRILHSTLSIARYAHSRIANTLNGLTFVPLEEKAAKQWSTSATASPAEHPWRDLYKIRKAPSPEAKELPATSSVPEYYWDEVREPRELNKTVKGRGTGRGDANQSTRPYPHETVRLCDVEAFRATTARKVALADSNQDEIARLTDGLVVLNNSSSIRTVIYRYIDVIKNSIALLEAIHFELFMPDRPDLRFLGVPSATVPSGTLEGDYFRVIDADLLSGSSFALGLHQIYPVVWEAKKIQRMVFDDGSLDKKKDRWAYIMKNESDVEGVEMVVSEDSDRAIPIPHQLFPDEVSRKWHSLIRMTSMNMGTAHLYAVEPLHPRPIILKKKKGQEKGDGGSGGKMYPRTEYLKRICSVRTSSQRAGRVASRVSALAAKDAEWIEDRLGTFSTYGRKGDVKLMVDLFRLGCRYRDIDRLRRDEDNEDELETDIEESVIFETLMEKDFGDLTESRPLFDCIYGMPDTAFPGFGEKKKKMEKMEKRKGKGKTAIETVEQSVIVKPHKLSFVDGSDQVTFNEAQSRAVSLYADADGPRVFCVIAPPGSGKTTVAAAMAAEVARSETFEWQMLLSVQNVAVDNMGAALKKMDYGGGMIYNLKSTRRLDLHCPAPFDFLDLMHEKKLKQLRITRTVLEREMLCTRDQAERDKMMLVYEKELTADRKKYENDICPTTILSTVEMVLHQRNIRSKMNSDLHRVRRIIIDEASLLTEAALFCLIRHFPQARFMLMGDDHQLPPFMYESTILGSQLAGRSALSVAMKNGNLPVVELNEVYRAPPSLVEPYNRLAYGGRLVSKKAEGESPLSEVGLIESGKPQLLLIDAGGKHEKTLINKSLYNMEEIKAVKRLLSKFPTNWKDEIMIICLYQEQKRRLQSALDNDFTILTVDSAQGKEKSIVILMTTRTEIPKAGTFFISTERCNVAISRQKKALVILGKVDLLTTNKPWSTVVNGKDFTRIRAENL